MLNIERRIAHQSSITFFWYTLYYTWKPKVLKQPGPALERELGGGGCTFIYSGYARLISFEINFITKETSRAEPEYMNIHPPISVLAPALNAATLILFNYEIF